MPYRSVHLRVSVWLTLPWLFYCGFVIRQVNRRRFYPGAWTQFTALAAAGLVIAGLVYIGLRRDGDRPARPQGADVEDYEDGP
jgi:hypothetical protein